MQLLDDAEAYVGGQVVRGDLVLDAKAMNNRFKRHPSITAIIISRHCMLWSTWTALVLFEAAPQFQTESYPPTMSHHATAFFYLHLFTHLTQVTKAVISVPAHFTAAQREATANAGVWGSCLSAHVCSAIRFKAPLYWISPAW